MTPGLQSNDGIDGMGFKRKTRRTRRQREGAGKGEREIEGNSSI